MYHYFIYCGICQKYGQWITCTTESTYQFCLLRDRQGLDRLMNHTQFCATDEIEQQAELRAHSDF